MEEEAAVGGASKATKKRVLNVVADIVRKEGARSLFRGYTAAMLRAEKVHEELHRRYGYRDDHIAGDEGEMVGQLLAVPSLAASAVAERK